MHFSVSRITQAFFLGLLCLITVATASEAQPSTTVEQLGPLTVDGEQVDAQAIHAIPYGDGFLVLAGYDAPAETQGLVAFHLRLDGTIVGQRELTGLGVLQGTPTQLIPTGANSALFGGVFTDSDGQHTMRAIRLTDLVPSVVISSPSPPPSEVVYNATSALGQTVREFMLSDMIPVSNTAVLFVGNLIDGGIVTGTSSPVAWIADASGTTQQLALSTFLVSDNTGVGHLPSIRAERAAVSSTGVAIVAVVEAHPEGSLIPIQQLALYSFNSQLQAREVQRLQLAASVGGLYPNPSGVGFIVYGSAVFMDEPYGSFSYAVVMDPAGPVAGTPFRIGEEGFALPSFMTGHATEGLLTVSARTVEGEQFVYQPYVAALSGEGTTRWSLKGGTVNAIVRPLAFHSDGFLLVATGPNINEMSLETIHISLSD